MGIAGEENIAPFGAGEFYDYSENMQNHQPKPGGSLFLILTVLVLMMASILRAEDVVTNWNKVMLATIAADGTDPITSTRTAAIVQAAVFDSVNGIERKYIPIHANIPKPDGASNLRR